MLNIKSFLPTIKSLFSDIRVKILLTILAVCLVILLLAKIYYFGYNNASLKYQNEALARDNAVQAELLKAQANKQIIEKKVYVKDLETVRELETKNTILQNKITGLQKEIKNYVPKEVADWKLPVDAVRVFDSAAKGDASGGNTATTPPSKSSSEDSTITNINGMDTAEYTIEIAGRYNKARNQCNALIDWVDENIVKAKE